MSSPNHSHAPASIVRFILLIFCLLLVVGPGLFAPRTISVASGAERGTPPDMTTALTVPGGGSTVPVMPSLSKSHPPVEEGLDAFLAATFLLSSMQTGPSLVAHWKFDEVGGTSAADETGSGNTGTLSGAVWSTGKIGAGALNFDGVNDRVNIASTAGITSISNNFTLAFWVYPRSTHQIDAETTTGAGGVSGQKYVWGPNWFNNEGGGAGSGVSVGTNGVSVYEHAAGYMPAPLVYQGTLTGWTHVVVIYENKQPRLYVNGVLVKTGLTSPRTAVGIVPWGVGGVDYGYLDGELDDLRLYSGVLPASEIALLANPANGITEARGKQYVTWLPAANAATPGDGTLRNSGGGNATTSATQTLMRGDGYFESTASNYSQFIWITGADGSYRQILIGTGGWAQIVENGVEVAVTCCAGTQIAPHAPGDRYRMEITGGVLRYVRYRGAGRSVMYTSAAPLPSYPIKLYAQINSQNTEWQRTVVAQTIQQVAWASVSNGGDLGGGTVRKTSAEGWDFSAVAQERLVKGDGYFESTSSSSYHQSINLTGADGAVRGLVFGTGGWAGIYENGVAVADTCCMASLIPAHLAGDRYRMEVAGGKLRYVLYRAGVRTLMYTSANPLPTYPLTLSLGASPQNAEWQNTVVAQATRSSAWTSITNGGDLGGGTVRKTSAEGWDFNAAAQQSILGADGYFESTSSSSYNQSINLSGADGTSRGFLFGTGGWAAIYENGVQVADTCCMASLIPVHLAGDRYRIEIAGGKLRYVLYRGGVRTVMYTSANPLPAYPLKPSLGGSPQNSEWQNSVGGENAPEYNDAAFVSQSVPSTMRPGQVQSVSVVLKNTGTSAWTLDNDYRLGSQNAQDNQTWGLNRINLTTPVLPGETATFTFNVTAPQTLGTYNFQWQMLQERVESFGAMTTNMTVTVNNTSPLVSISSPANGATFGALDNVTINANASDSDGTVAKVEFFQNGAKLGEDAAAPYSFTWNSVAAGAYSLTAKATDDNGAVTTSAAISIYVAPPTVSVTATDGAASEPGADTATFVVSRTGNTSQALAVNFTLGGTATNGADYVTLPFSVTIPAGALSQPISVTPVDDSVTEGIENVTLTLAAGAAYIIGTPSDAAVTISDNDTPPNVSITSPAGGAVFHAPATITITANASDADQGGSVSKVEFFRNGVKLGEDATAPYSYVWSNAPVGSSTLTAVATDNVNVTGLSSPVTIIVNAPPTVSISSPAGGSVFSAPATITISANASDSNDTVSKVEFFQGAVKLGEDTSAPYSFQWTNVPSGTYSLTARATDDAGATTISGAISITVDNPLSIQLTSPSNNANFDEGSNVNLNAVVSGGTPAKVEFFQGATKLGEDTSAPYSFVWANVPKGTYSLTAVATNSSGATTSSSAVNINVINFTAALLNPANRTGSGGVDLFSGNFNWSLPLLGLKGRAGLDLGLSLAYNSLVWTEDGTTVKFNPDNSYPGPGFRLGFPTIQGPFYNSQTSKNAYLLLTSSGAREELRATDTANLYEAVDSSRLQLTVAGAMVLRATDGTRLSYAFFGGEYHCVQIKDANGNFITASYDGQGALTSITDTLARLITFNYDTNHNLQSITQDWDGQTHQWATFGHAAKTVQHTFSNVTVVGPQNGQAINMLAWVALPDGSRYEFGYNGFAQINQITRKSGTDTQTPLSQQLAYTAYDYSAETARCPRVTAQRDWAKDWNKNSGGVEQEVVTTYGRDADGAWGEVTAPDGTRHKEFYGTGWQKGLVTESQVWVGSVKEKWTTLQWTQDEESLTYQLNPRVTETHVWDKENNHKRTRVAYYEADKFRLPSDTYEYAADASTVLRRAHINYHLPTEYINQRIIGLVSAQYVYGRNASGAEKLASRVSYAYDETNEGRLVATTLNNSPVEPAQHDAAYDTNVKVRGNVTSTQQYDVSDESLSVVSKIGYDTAGNAVFTRDPEEHEERLSYADSFVKQTVAASARTFNFSTFAYPTTVTDPDGNTATVKYDYDMGAVRKAQTPLPNTVVNTPGPIQTISYDAVGRIGQVTSDTNQAYTKYVYSPTQDWVKTYKTIKDANTEVYAVQLLDGAGRVIASASDFPGSQGLFRGQWTVYDVMGRAAQVSNQTEINGNWVPAGDDAPENGGTGWIYAQQAYDWQGRPTVTTHADTALTTRETLYGGCGCAGGEVVTTRDEVGRRQKVTYDVLGRVWKTQVLYTQDKLQPLSPGTDADVYSTTTNTYNEQDQVTEITQQAGVNGTTQSTMLTYNGYRQLASRKAPEATAATVYTYYADSNVHIMTDGRGATTTFTYNGRHQVRTVSYDTAGVAEPTADVEYQYDAAGNRLWMDDGPGKVDYSYDALSMLSLESRYFSSLNHSYPINYDYNVANQLTKVTAPNGAIFNYQRNAEGQLTAVTGSLYAGVTNYVTDAKYRSWGGLKSATYGNNTSSTIKYNVRLQPSEFRLTNDTNGGSSIIRENYSYYPDGRLATLTDLDDTAGTNPPSTLRFLSRSFGYDHVGRVTGGSGSGQGGGRIPFQQSYGYDVFGNMTSRSGSYYNYMALPAQTDTPTFTNNRRAGWTYDADGRVTYAPPSGGSGRSSYYDAAGRLVRSDDTAGGSTLIYTTSYDGDGRVVSEAKQNVTVAYTLRSTILGEPLTVLTASGAISLTHVPAQGLIFARQLSSGVGWTQRNPLGITETNRGVYDPLGNYIPFKAMNDPRPAPGQYSSASMSGESSSLSDPQNYGMGCFLDGGPANCTRVARMVNHETAVVTYMGGVMGGSPSQIIPIQRGDKYIPGKDNPETPGIFNAGTTIGFIDVYFYIPPGAQFGIEPNPTDPNPTDPNPTEPQNSGQSKSDCGNFIDQLISQLSPLLLQQGIGRGMARWAQNTLAPLAQKNKLGFSGFKEKYIAGGQNGWALVHVAGVAGVTLVGNNRVDPSGLFYGNQTGYQRAQAQLDEDTSQLNAGLARQAAGHTTIDYVGDPKYSLDKYIAEKHAERWGTGAGATVGQILAQVQGGSKSKDTARGEIFNLLCDR